jgi:hypothetical protein
VDKSAVKSASESLARARAALSAIEHSQSLPDIETAWSDFLVAANRVYSRLEQGAKTDGTSTSWFGRKKNERKSSALLQYVHHARNADEHGLAKVTDRTAPALAIGVGRGAWRIDGTTGPGGQLKVTALGGQTAESKFVESIPSSVRLVTAIDRGVSYQPPKNEHGYALLPNEVAEKVIDHLGGLIEEADRL